MNHRDVVEDEILNARNDRGQTPLIIALKKKEKFCAVELLEAGAKIFPEDKRGAFVATDDPRLKHLATTHKIDGNFLEKLLRERWAIWRRRKFLKSCRLRLTITVMTEEQRHQFAAGVQLFNEKPKKVSKCEKMGEKLRKLSGY